MPWPARSNRSGPPSTVRSQLSCLVARSIDWRSANFSHSQAFFDCPDNRVTTREFVCRGVHGRAVLSGGTPDQFVHLSDRSGDALPVPWSSRRSPSSFSTSSSFLLYWPLGKEGQNRLIVVSGLTFYGWWDWRFALLLLVTTGIDYAVGLALEHEEDARKRRAWLILSLVTNLGVLAFFKYFNFFSDAFVRFAGCSASTLRPSC